MSILLEQLTKRYDGHPVVNHVSLEVGDAEFFVLLGASGSGKSTILRMVAGLAGVDEGRVVLHGRDVTGIPPQQRGVGFVFQHYALFRHMSAAQNIEFGLGIRKVPAAERRRRRDELLELVGLAGLGARMPRQLSGGQQQRVALARALAYQPQVLLLDEPFGALDARIRVELRRTVKRIQRELGVTTIFVTHDQEEAFELADRLGVMNFGRLVEIGRPRELYEHPQTEFVASFLGTANLLVGEGDENGVRLGPVQIPLKTRPLERNGTPRVQVLFRPEDIELAPSQEELSSPPLGLGEVTEIDYMGPVERLRLRVPAIPGVRQIAPLTHYGRDSLVVEATRPQDTALRFPLQEKYRAWIGVRRVHALTHPGLSFLILTDGSPAGQMALSSGGYLARLAHARTTLLGYGADPRVLKDHLQAARQQVAAGLPSLDLRVGVDGLSQAVREESERHPVDLIIAGASGDGVGVAAQILDAAGHHLLLIRGANHQAASRVLICVAPGEPGKEDVGFAGRLTRHLGAEVTLLTVLGADTEWARERGERFTEGGIRTLTLLGVPAQAKVRAGPVRETILDEMTTGGYDLLVVGVPLDGLRTKAAGPNVVAQVLDAPAAWPVLMVRSTYLPIRGLREVRL